MVFKRLSKESFEDLEFNSYWKFQTRVTLSHKMAALSIFCEITQKSSFNSQYSSRRSLRSLKAFEESLKSAFYFILINLICYWQIKFSSYYAFWLNQMSDIREIWKCRPLKDGRHFVVDGPKNFKLLADICFESGLQNIVLPSLLLFSSACY